MRNTTKDNVNELYEASKNGVAVRLLRKAFDGEIIKNLKIVNGSMIANCTFIKTGFYGSSFTGCNFVKCDFSEADFYGVLFENCSFNSCNFNNSKFNMSKFDDKCILNGCTFDSVDLSNKNNVQGLDPKNLNIVYENLPKKPEANQNMIDLGFKFMDDCYVAKADDGLTFVSVCFDEEADCYRNMLFVKDEAYLTSDIDSLDEYTKDQLKLFIINNLKVAINKIDKDTHLEEKEKIIDSLNSLIVLINK